MTTWFVIVLGGALGTGARHLANATAAHLVGRPTPLATFAVNIIGCAAAGVLAGLLAADRLVLGPAARAFIFVGVLGGFTTFSSFGLDTFTLAHHGERTAALANVAGQVGLGLLAVTLGFGLASRS
jgi:fluoride exporter